MVAPTWDLMSSPMIGQAGLLEALVPVVLARDEHRDAVHEAAAGLQDLLDVPLGGLLGADRQVGDDDVGAGVLEHLDDVGGGAGRLGDLLLEVAAQAVVGHAAHDLDAELGDVVAELERVVLAGEDRLGEVLAHLVGVDVEGGGELDVAHVVAAEIDVHEAGHLLGRVGVLVVLDALHEGAGAVAHADDGDADLLVLVTRGAVGRTVAGGHVRCVPSLKFAGPLRSAGIATSMPRPRVGYTDL